jgi:hypothetical protein
MPPRLVDVITAADAAVRDLPLDALCRGLDRDALCAEAAALDAFRRRSENLYERVRALFFLHALHRYHLPRALDGGPGWIGAHVPPAVHADLLARRFEAGIDALVALQTAHGPRDAWSSALARAYRELGFQTLADQVRRSVRSAPGNRWMFDVARATDQPLRIAPELLARRPHGLTSVLRELTPVRMDLTHSAWSDVFFLAMDRPEGAKVLNVSIDLGVRGRDPYPRPPVEAYLRVIDRPVLRLVSVDLEVEAEITETAEVFDFAKDHLGLLKAAVIASGVVPPGLEAAASRGGERLGDLLATLAGPGRGLELASHVRGIPKGSRLAVSTNLLASLIVLCMRATGQTAALAGGLSEDERRLAVGRAILGEWLGGSGGGWQDSGGLWPGIKLIEGALARPGDPEHGTSCGRLLPDHRELGAGEVSIATRRSLARSLVLVHGGMAQDVGPVLEMVTERYLLRSEPEWSARRDALGVLDDVRAALRAGDVHAVGRATTRNFLGPIKTIIPWASNRYTELLIERVRARHGDRFWGFWMLGGMSGGGMGFLFDPREHAAAQQGLLEIMCAAKRDLEDALPFAMDPVVYDFQVNGRGSHADLLADEPAPFPPDYYALRVPRLVRAAPASITREERAELQAFAAAARRRVEFRGLVERVFDRLFPNGDLDAGAATLEELLEQNGFDAAQHELVRADLLRGRIGLARNRLPADVRIEDARAEDVLHAGDAHRADGAAALARGELAVVTLAAGSGSRWTQGAGTVKALAPVGQIGGRHRSFLELHLAKTRAASRAAGASIPHVVTTSYLTHAPIERWLASGRLAPDGAANGVDVALSPGRSVGLRLVPMVRDLRFSWEEQSRQVLDEQAEKVRTSHRSALCAWAREAGEGADYRDNLPHQCLHPVGHWYEVPNLLLNGTLARLLAARPALTTLLLHNVDTLGAAADPALLGAFRASGAALAFELVPRRFEDSGGGLARVNGRPRLVESLALPREEDELALSWYSSMTTWIDVDGLLRAFGLDRAMLAAPDGGTRVQAGVRELAARMPTYVTLKDVKKRWGHGQEDVFPVAQFEKLWGDMSALLPSAFLAVPRERGQQLKEPAQLDAWVRDGSAGHVEGLCAFG